MLIYNVVILWHRKFTEVVAVFTACDIMFLGALREEIVTALKNILRKIANDNKFSILK